MSWTSDEYLDSLRSSTDWLDCTYPRRSIRLTGKSYQIKSNQIRDSSPHTLNSMRTT